MVGVPTLTVELDTVEFEFDFAARLTPTNATTPPTAMAAITIHFL
jgi:hypothetical protein